MAAIATTGGTTTSRASASSSDGALVLPATSIPTVGVSTGEIRLGVVYADPGISAMFGTPANDVPTSRDVADYYRAGLGTDPTVNGRRIKLVTGVYQATDQTDPVRQCVKLTEDQDVFAVITQRYVAGGAQCVAGDHHRIILEDQADNDKAFSTAPGLMFSVNQSNARLAAGFAAQLVASGALRGQTIGVLASNLNGNKTQVDHVLVPALEKAGYHVAAVTNLSGDVSVQQSQIPAAVDLFRQKHVTFIIAADEGPTIGFTAGQARRLGYRPRWAFSDFGDAANLSSSYTTDMVGSMAFTNLRLWDPKRPDSAMTPARTSCIDNYKAATGKVVTPGSNKFNILMSACQLTQIFVRAAKAAGPDLTVQSFSKAMQQLGKVESPYRGMVDFQPGRFDGGAGTRQARLTFPCPGQPRLGCFVPATGFTAEKR